MANVLASLCAHGVLERPAGRPLRVSPRFLAHAEGTAGRMRILGMDADAALDAALTEWTGQRDDAARAVLMELLGRQEQWGALRPVFPAIAA